MMARMGFAQAVALAMGVIVLPAGAQDYTHPKDMDLPEVRFDRPDPGEMRVDLANGLAAYIAVDDRAPLVTLSAFIAAGSAHGAPGEGAVVTAALQRGPSGMSDGSFTRALDRMAAVYTVTLGREETEITLDVPAEDGWEAMELLAAVLRDPAFGASRSGGTARASQAAGIDWATSIAGAIATFDSRLFAGHTFGRAASAAEMEAASNGGAQAYYRRYFVPSNAVLAISGDFQIMEASTRTMEAFEDWSGGDRPDPMTFQSIQTSGPRKVLLAEAGRLQGWVVTGHELPVVPREDRAALAVMDYILGAYHLDSRLFRESRELRGLTNDNSSFMQPGVRGPGSYTFRTYGRPEAVRLLVDVTFRELTKIRETRPTDDEMFVAKGALVDGLWAARYATGLDATRNYAIEWLREGNHDGSESYPERIAAVTGAQIQEVAQRYIHPERMVIVVVGPLERIQAAPMIESEPHLDFWGSVERVSGGR